LGYPNQPLVSANTWNLPGPADAPNGQIPLTFCYATVNLNTGLVNGGTDALGVGSTTNFPSGLNYNVTTDYHEWVLTGVDTVLQSIVLPDGTYWAFSYDSAAAGSSPTIGYGSLLSIK